MNKYVFDYKLVLAECPKYGLFLRKELIEEDIEENPYRPGLREPMDDDDIRGQRITEAESDIINFVHDGSANEIHRRRINMEDELAATNSGTKYSVYLKEKYRLDPPNPNFDPSIPALPPPNRFLDNDSRIWLNENTYYRLQDDRSAEFISIIHKYKFSHVGNKIRLIRAQYRFDRKKNYTADLKKYLSILVYNTDTKELYSVKKIKKKSYRKRSPFKTVVKKIFNILSIHSGSLLLSNPTPKPLRDKFMNAVIQAVRKDVPGAIIMDKIPQKDISSSGHFRIKVPMEKDDYESRIMILFTLILQHKIGQPIGWLNHTLIKNLWVIVSDPRFYSEIIYNFKNFKEAKALKNMRRKTVFRLVPALRKSNHMRTAIKTLLGPYYNKFFLRLFNTLQLSEFLRGWVYCAHHGLIGKSLHHWLTQTINNNDAELLHKVFETVVVILISLRHSHFNINPNTTLLIDSYIKICQRFGNENSLHDLRFPNLHTWLDIYNMADQIDIRIRPNKFKNAGEILDLHNKLSSIINRDKTTRRKYENVIFEEFSVPDKEYDGFRFVQLKTADELVYEGTVMHHCVGSYADKCADGRSIIFSMRKDDKSYVTIEVSPTTYEIVQQYTLHDITITSGAVLDIIDEWRNDYMDLHKNDEISYYQKVRHKTKIDNLKAKIDNLKEIASEHDDDLEPRILKQIQKYEDEYENMVVEHKLSEVMNAQTV